MNLRLLFDRDGAVRALYTKWFANRPDRSLFLLSQLVVADEVIRGATVEDEGSIRGVKYLREIRILYQEEVLVHVLKFLPSVVSSTGHIPCIFASHPFTKFDIAFMIVFFWVRW